MARTDFTLAKKVNNLQQFESNRKLRSSWWDKNLNATLIPMV